MTCFPPRFSERAQETSFFLAGPALQLETSNRTGLQTGAACLSPSEGQKREEAGLNTPGYLP